MNTERTTEETIAAKNHYKQIYESFCNEVRSGCVEMCDDDEDDNS